MNDPRLEYLLDRYFDQALTAEESDELNGALLASPAARDLFWKRQTFHALLRQWGEQTWGVPQPTEAETRGGAPMRRRRSMLLRTSVLACTACGVIAASMVGLWWAWHNANEEPMTAAVAVLTRTADAKWSDNISRSPGANLAPGWLHLRSGLAQIEFISGARVILEGPAEFQIVSPMESFCRSGKLSAEVPPPARGFAVRLPNAKVVDLGTSFGVVVDPSNKAEVKVLKGEIQVQQSSGPRGLSEGQSVRLDADGSLRDLATSNISFATAASLNELASEGSKQRQEQWLAAMEKLKSDPSLLIQYDFANVASWSRTLPNRAPRTADAASGSLVGSRWVEGRWPGKGALEFHGVTDRVRFALEGTHDQLTLAAWVRVDSLDLDLNGLLMSDGFTQGAIHWQLTRQGKMRLGIGGGQPLDTDTPPVFVREHFGQWTHLAVVCDRARQRVTGYVDGRPLVTATVRMPAPLHIGNAELGNWNPGTKRDRMPIRNLGGRIDELLVFDRALSDEEVMALAQVGKSEF